MNIVETITSVNQFDLLIVLILFAMFILGFIQGTVRRVLGLGATLFAFLVACAARDPLGEFLSQNWTQFTDEYAVMVGFGTIFVALSITVTLLIQSFYKKAPLFEKYVVVDEVLGGLLGIVQGLLFIGIMIVILDSTFQIPGVPPRNELPFLREIHAAYTDSVTAQVMRNTLIPGFFFVFGLFVPQGLKDLFPAGGGG